MHFIDNPLPSPTTVTLLCSGFSPLTGFMNKEDYESVVTDLRLKVQKENEDLDME